MSLLLIFIIISGLIYIVSEYVRAPKIKYFFKPLTTVLVIILAFQQVNDWNNTYAYLVIIGLLFSLIGDVFLMLPKDKFLHGLTTFLIAHLFFIVAIFTGLNSVNELVALIPIGLYTLLFLWKVLPKAKENKLAVIIYSLILMVFFWQASLYFYYFATLAALNVFLGALFFVISDSLLAYSRFVKQSVYSVALIHISYWAALTYIALSI
ncbi:MAG: hypothetical protein C0598_05150 [Marinilabiliales bacterium]|nr:MAG: hypothetical protein C0598_05150 [Marinilabiliales bacterium]